jgi:EAL domain-containing protein (putative c-di-GMP-specific phosphodiesterase class I)
LAVISAIVALAKAMPLQLVVEGVETAAQTDRLRALNRDEFQGFLFGRAVSAAQFGALLRQRVEIAAV